MSRLQSRKPIFKILLLLFLCLLIAAVIGWGAFSIHLYDENINQRYDNYEPQMLYVEDYEGLSRTQYQFPSDRGQMLTGYLYTASEEPRGILILAHGMGAGHNSYLECINYFAQNGYDVFAYDATGCGESEGDSIGGVPQGPCDLDHAITFVEESGNFPALPIGLFGHSWGAYSVSSVLTFHPEVKAVIECAGCNCSSDLFEAVGKRQAGGIVDTMMPFIRLHERIHYGKYASNTALDGFAASDAAVMVVHSADDGVVPVSYGYDVFERVYGDDPRFSWLLLEDKGHNYMFDGRDYIDELNAAFDAWLGTLEYDYTAAENHDRFVADKKDWMTQNLDRERWCHMLNTELTGTFLAFYDANMT